MCVLCVLHPAWGGFPFAGNRTIPHSCASMFGPPVIRTLVPRLINTSTTHWLAVVGGVVVEIFFFPLAVSVLFFYLCLFIAPRTRPHTCTRSQRKRRNTSTETETYVKMLNWASARDERVHKLFFFFSFVRSGTATTTTTTALSPAGSVDCTLIVGFGCSMPQCCTHTHTKVMTLVFLTPSELQTQRREPSVSILPPRSDGAFGRPLLISSRTATFFFFWHSLFQKSQSLSGCANINSLVFLLHRIRHCHEL